MAEEARQERAVRLFRKAYEHQMKKELDEAVELYKKSIDAYPTAEAHTFLGWTYSWMGRLDDAIAECLKAIDVDPRFGNPYNDIGSYLIMKGQIDQAIPWLELAKRDPRYEPRHFPHLKLFRLYMKLGILASAQHQREQARCIQHSRALATRGGAE